MKKLINIGNFGICLLAIYIIIEFFNIPSSYSAPNNVETENIIINNNSILWQENNVLYVDYAKLNEFLKDMNSYIYYNNELKTIYYEIIDKYYNADKLKMYEENNKKVLEINYDKDDGKNIYKSYIKNYYRLTVKVLFRSIKL